jgi:tetratricopeptide (TPR) repeat protein
VTWRYGVAALLLASCGGQPAPDALQDSALAQAAASGRQALEFSRLKQAVGQYQQAYALAMARDDPQAIGDSGYNLAVAQLADNDAAGALRTAQRTRDALATRAAPSFAELDLIQSAALHRLGREAEADTLAARAQATASSLMTSARASYVRGLIADTRGDAAGIAAALAGFGQPKTPSAGWEADRDELIARLDMLRGQYRQAAGHAQRAADLHRAQLDYRAMADTTALAAKAMQRAGSPQEAANLYLQAGESAAARGDAASAKRWLMQVIRPGVNADTQRTAKEALAALQKAPSR